MDNVQWTLVSSLYRSIIVIVFPIVLNLPLDSFFSEWFAVVHKEETKTWKDQAHILRYFLYLDFANFTKLLLICFGTPSLLEPESSPRLEFRVGCWHFGLFLKSHPSFPPTLAFIDWQVQAKFPAEFLAFWIYVAVSSSFTVSVKSWVPNSWTVSPEKSPPPGLEWD